MKDADFPAAHSMDSSWYAVDRNGNVGLFITDDNGGMPNEAYSPEAQEFLEELEEDREGLRIERRESISPERLPDSTRLYVYSADSGFLGDVYGIQEKPKRPLHLDELPPDVREAISRVCFDKIDFVTTTVIQPYELVETNGWNAAYTSSDGKTIRPVPGREEEYGEFIQELQGMLPPDVTIEELPPKKRAPRRKKPKGKEDPG